MADGTRPVGQNGHHRLGAARA